MVRPRETTKKITPKNIGKKSLKKFKCYAKEYSIKEKKSKVGRDEQKRHETQKTKIIMTDINSTISIIITLCEWIEQNTLINKIHLYATYRSSLDSKIHRGWN